MLHSSKNRFKHCFDQIEVTKLYRIDISKDQDLKKINVFMNQYSINFIEVVTEISHGKWTVFENTLQKPL